MKSPLTGKIMKLSQEIRALEFRKESFEIVYHFYLCEDTKQQFTSTELDELNITQLYNQYRDKHNLPFPDEIISIREQYDIPATRMSDILGFGINSYRNYEGGEVPNHSNGKLVQMAKDPKKFKQLVEIWETDSPIQKEKLLKRVEALSAEYKSKRFVIEFDDYLMGSRLPDEFSGYRSPDRRKFTEMVKYFTQELEPFKTKLNKLLFYSDFLCFKRTCYSISGVRYRAIPMGPVPNNFNSIFDRLANEDAVDVWTTEFPNGSIGDQFKPRLDRPFDPNLFSKAELEVLHHVAKRFRSEKTSDIIETSHKEKAWLENEKERNLISYRYAFELTQL